VQDDFCQYRAAQEQSVVVMSHEGPAGKIKRQTAIHLGVEVEVEVIECFVKVTKGSLLFSALQQAVAATM